MKKHLLLLLVLFGATLGNAVAQSRPASRNSIFKRKSKAVTGSRDANQSGGALLLRQRAGEEGVPAPMVSKIIIKKPVLVYYEEPAPGKSVHQLIMGEEHLGLLKSLDLEHLMARREVFVDGLNNLALAGHDDTKFRLLGTSGVAEDTRRPAGDGRSFYARLKVPSSTVLYVVRESAEGYRHFVKGPQKNGALLDFQSNGLPGVDSVRAVYTLRKMSAAERGAGSGRTVR
ncbi:MAG: hypothetical protein NVS3B25_28160 [Hymenobacter sp.]